MNVGGALGDPSVADPSARFALLWSTKFIFPGPLQAGARDAGGDIVMARWRDCRCAEGCGRRRRRAVTVRVVAEEALGAQTLVPANEAVRV